MDLVHRRMVQEVHYDVSYLPLPQHRHVVRDTQCKVSIDFFLNKTTSKYGALASLDSVVGYTVGVVGVGKSVQTSFCLVNFAGDQILRAAHPPPPRRTVVTKNMASGDRLFDRRPVGVSRDRLECG